MTVVRDPRPSPQELVQASRAALGLEPLDLLITGGQVVNVWTRSISRADVGVKGRIIACVGECRARAERTISAEGKYVLPGFIDAHMHLESTMLSPPEFSKELLRHGTTAAFVDIHEVGNVLGLRGVRAVAEMFDRVKLKVFLLEPANVPPSRLVDDVGGAAIGYDESLAAAKGLSGMGEVMDLQALLEADEEFMEYAASASTSVLTQGHMAGLRGSQLDAYVSLGIRNDHEVVNEEELVDRLSRGVYPYVRYGSSWRDLDRLYRLVQAYSPLVPIVADDIHALHLVREGHLDRALRRAVQLGVDPVDAVRAVTLSPAIASGVEAWYGSVAPGRFADINIVSDLKEFKVVQTLLDGSEASCSPSFEVPSFMRDTVKVSFRPSLELRAPVEAGQVVARVIEVPWGSTLTRESVELLRVTDWRPAVSGELSEVHVINRYGRALEGSGLLGVAVDGALASTIAHDTHNLIVVGSDRASMERAVEYVVSHGGGIAVARGGSVEAGLPLPLAGLMSDMSSERVASELGRVTSRLSSACGCDGEVLLNQVQLLTLTVIPELRVTDRGLYSVSRRSYVPLMEAG